jgi:tryptophanyl-tRNA synthetase
LRKLIMGVVTDSRAPGEAKDVGGSALYSLYQAFATPDQAMQMRERFAGGLAWGEAKLALFELVDAQVAPMRERYQQLMSRPAEIEAILQAGAVRARAIATPFMAQLRAAVGLRALSPAAASSPAAVGEPAQPMPTIKPKPSIKQYRERDGLFYFKLIGGDGRTLLLSGGHESARAAGELIARLKLGDAEQLTQPGLRTLQWGDSTLGELAEGVGMADVADALARFAAAALDG